MATYRTYSVDLIDWSRPNSMDAPYNKVLTYERNICRFLYDHGNGDGVADPTASTTQNIANDTGHYLPSDFVLPLKARAGESLYRKARDNTDLAETIAEVSGTMASMTMGAGRLVRSYQYLRKGKVSKAFSSLIVDRKKGRPKTSVAMSAKRAAFNPEVARRRALEGNLADAYLAWEFAIKPTIESISDSVEFLQSHPVVQQVYGQASNRFFTEDSTYFGNRTDYHTHAYTVKVFAGMRSRLVNPNLALADSYGFMNPIKLGWDFIPMSFLVDYFVPVGRFLNAFSPLYGREISMPFTTRLTKGTYDFTSFSKYYGKNVDRRYQKVSMVREGGVRSNYSPQDVINLKLPPKSAADTTIALAIKTFRS